MLIRLFKIFVLPPLPSHILFRTYLYINAALYVIVIISIAQHA